MTSLSRNPDRAPPARSGLALAARWRSLPAGLRSSAGLIALLILMVVVFAQLNPRFGSVENLHNVLYQVSVPLIVVVGTTMVIQMGSIDLSVQGVMGGAGMTWILLSPNTRTALDLGPWAWAAALGVGLGIGLLTGLIHARLKVPSFVGSLGTWYIGLGLGILLYGNDMLPSLNSEALERWPTRLSLGAPNAFWLATAALAFGLLVMNHTRLGRGILAIGNNETIAGAMGLPVAGIKTMAFVLAGGLSALAGILATMQLGSGSPDIGSGQLFTVIPAAVIGGTALSGGEGGMLRSALGVFLLIILNNGLVLAGVHPDYQSGVFGAILVTAIVAVAWPQRGRLKVAK